MATAATVGESQLQRIIRDLHDAVAELAKEYRETGEPITDDSTNLHKFSYKLEYLLQFDQKEKSTFLGTKKDYWEYFSDCLAKIKGANDGIRFVKSIAELKTSLGKGRAFIRYSLVHQRLADTLQQCLMNQRVTGDWYYARSPFLKPHLSVDIINHLYELNEVQFDVASRGHDLDASWPTFARRTLGANSPGHMWKPPSRSSSINSLASTYSQQAAEFLPSPDYGHSLLNDLNESACTDDGGAVDDLRLELDQSELKQRELLDKVQQLGAEATELRGVVVALQGQLDASLGNQERQQEEHRLLRGREEALSGEVGSLRSRERAMESELARLQEKLTATEEKNLGLIAKLDGVLNEKGQQAASHFDSAQKIHELLDRLKEAENGKMEAAAEAEEKRRLAQRLEEELGLKEAATRDGDAKLEILVKSTSEEKAALQTKVEGQCAALDQLQGALTLRENEASNLQKQLQDLQGSLEDKEKELEGVKRKSQEDMDELHRVVGGQKETLEAKAGALREQVEEGRAELTSTCETLAQLEAENRSLNAEREKLEGSVKDQTSKVEDYKTQCATLMELNGKLLTTVKRNEELKKEAADHRAALEAELASLRASEKQLRGQMDDAKMTVDEKEKLLREENRGLDEGLQRAVMAAKQAEVESRRLEQENQSLREEQDTVKAALGRMQADLRSVHGQIGELEKNLGASRRSEAGLQEKLQTKEAQLASREKDLVELQSRVGSLEAREKELEEAKAVAEAAYARQQEAMERVTSEKQAVEKSQLERSAVQAKESQEVSGKLEAAEGQLEFSMKEVSRLQAEVLDLRVRAQRSEEKSLRSQAQLEVTEAQRDELRTLTEQLKCQAEALNQRHVAELLEAKGREEALAARRDEEVAARGELAVAATALREELSAQKARCEQLVLELGETREGLHRANTEMAELGMTICKLGAEKEEAAGRRAADAARIQELEGAAELLEECVTQLRLENNRLKERLAQAEALPGAVAELREQLEKAKSHAQSAQVSSREGLEAVKFQMSSDRMSHQTQMKSVTEQLDKVKAQLDEELQNVSGLQAKVSKLEAENEQYLLLATEKDAHITKTEATNRGNEDEIQQLRDSLSRTEEAHAAAQKLCEELKLRLDATEADMQIQHLKMSAEIDDLNRTKNNLGERLIELIRDKDALWQKSDALEFEQKLRAEERWWLVDKEATHCLGCQGQFTWWLRRHHCRLCGRIFCYYCSNNFAMTKHSEKKERCCRECYTQHSAVVERFTEAELSPSDAEPPPPGAGPQPPPEPAPYKPTPSVTVSDPSNKSDDGAYDIITEEDVNGVYDSDTNSQTTGGSLEGEHDPATPGALDIGARDLTSDDPEELVPTVQDSEISLLRSGEVTMAVPLTVDDISHFGDASRELFVKSSCYSAITVAVGDCGPTISWTFSSEPKSISFSVLYGESTDAPVEQSKVLIPLTRCNAHKETIQGQLKVRQPGLYTLIFDNSFSRFISKKVFYHLNVEKPVIYDGSDLP